MHGSCADGRRREASLGGLNQNFGSLQRYTALF